MYSGQINEAKFREVRCGIGNSPGRIRKDSGSSSNRQRCEIGVFKMNMRDPLGWIVYRCNEDGEIEIGREDFAKIFPGETFEESKRLQAFCVQNRLNMYSDKVTQKFHFVAADRPKGSN